MKNLWSKLIDTLKHMRGRSWLVIGVLLVLILAIGLPVLSARRRAAAAVQYQTVKADKGTLTAIVGATGTVRARQTAILSWLTTGTIGEVKVQPGDQVQAGDVLASLSETSLPQNIILAQANLVTAQRNLDSVLHSSLARAQAEQNLANAQKNYNTTKSNYAYQTTQRADRETIDDARAQVVLANQKVDAMQHLYNDTAGLPEDNVTRANAYSNLYDAIKARDRAVATYNWYIGKPTQQDLDILNANLAVAQAQLDDAQREWNRLKNGPDPNDVAAAQAQVDAAQATIHSAQIIAPFSGTVTEVNSLVGDQVSPGTGGFRVDDLSHLLVDVQVSEVDINTVQVDQPVTLTFDAIPANNYTGKVVQVALAGDVSQGAVNFNVTVELTNPDAQVKPGMTAAVSIIVKQLDNVLLVPNRAVRLVNNQRVVYILQNGLPQEVQITLGASSDTNSQVTGGDLKVGDLIILNPPSTLFNRQPGGGGGGGPFGGGG